MEFSMLQTPGTRTQYLVGEDVGSAGVRVRDRETRTACSLQFFRPVFSTELVFGVWFYRDKLKDPSFGGVLSIKGDRQRLDPVMKLRRVYGQDSVRIRLIPPIKPP